MPWSLSPSSPVPNWVRERVAIEGLADVDEDRCYRAMDWLLEIEEPLAEAVYWSVADLLDLEVDLLFFDTTSTYFESSGDDREVNGEKVVGFRTFGHSKDSRPDLPQVVIGMPSPGPGFRSGSGPGLATPTTRS